MLQLFRLMKAEAKNYKTALTKSRFNLIDIIPKNYIQTEASKGTKKKNNP